MHILSIEHLWSSLWAMRFGQEDVRLRFALGGEERDNANGPVPRFLRGHGRASAIADAMFRAGCVGIVASNSRLSDPAALPDDADDGFAALRRTGFHAPQIGEWRAALHSDRDDDAYVWDFRSYDLGHDKIARDTLLWHAVASEMSISPSAPIVTFLLDPGASMMLHVYDDRGMDVIAYDPAKLGGIYSNFADWLLHHDRERMAKLF